MTEDELRRDALAHVRHHFNMLVAIEHKLNRMDWLWFAASIATITALSFVFVDDPVDGLVLGIGYGIGMTAGVRMAFRKMRRRSFALLKDQYHEIELQNMIEEETEGG